MTLWLHTLEDGTTSRDSEDHSWMHRLADELDEICVEEGVTKLSDFFDYSDIEFNHDDELVEDWDEDADELSDESDSEDESGGDEMNWFDAEEGIDTLTVLRDVVEVGDALDLEGRERDDLLEELDDCLKRLEDTATRDGKFHLAVVE